MRRPARLWLAVLLATVLAAPRTSFAAPTEGDPRRAAEAFRAAQLAFGRGEFTQAGALFEAANRISPHPATMLDAAEAWELGGQPARAADACDAVVAMGTAPYVANAQARLARLKTKLGSLRLSGASTWVVRVDGAEEIRPPKSVWLSPGSHTMEIAGRSGTTRRAVELAAGAVTDVALGSDEAPRAAPADREASSRPPPATTAMPTSSGPPALAIVALGVSTVCIGGAVYFGVRTLDAQDSFDRNPTFDARDDFYRAKTLTNVAIGVGAAAAIAGIALWVFAKKTGPTTTSLATKEALIQW
ncbi:MAG: hypothetical protein JST00_35660 [Deltaproteobacteria bacterium]|nr:hypothetical protein [Deltaproteobacteria bacterium]